ncbi:methylated-DNA--[protein]-cysteine S-methyltransferase [Actinomycetospora cinnamomea]|uniref:methylated-DNA--[protein]-cysteine S-methyltransferase n=1 Tax=Actinomycetospora cinnamomea TaxID=663609 RepID=A0A2U1FLZ9_9PSEU|nr:methylated-DNA--[protein]-cysteine S-methyltransferase [Actinomycetospora cinnamomea]PVZ13176.1 methylated-DNA-[protein]-cysteine S-methyltransferase [Actinomycetospora cinnamomea]
MSVVHDTTIGPLHLDATARGLTLLGFWPGEAGDGHGPEVVRVLDLARRELDAYFAGTLRAFTVPVDLDTHPAWDRRVLEGLASVGYGETVSYGELAASVGLGPGEARRVGGAMARNPVAIVVPCHRVLGADGSLTGYAGGLERKRTLLDLERRDSMLF